MNQPIRTTWPVWHLLGGMPYTPAVATDIRRTFAKVREAQEAERIARNRREAEDRYA